MPQSKTGAIVWKGKSLLDGKPIVLIATLGSSRTTNKKTGRMVQTYILRSDISPLEALKTGQDVSICGDCPHKQTEQGTCYVRVDTGPTCVYKAFARGSYPMLESVPNRFDGFMLRLGAYGDPAAIPLDVWLGLLKRAKGSTGYTHQWKSDPIPSTLRQVCMASCDNEEEDRQAKALGWRTFTLIPKGGAPIPGSFLCPASEEGGRKLTCSECLACDGLSSARHASVYIPVHGVAYKVKRFNSQQLITIGG